MNRKPEHPAQIELLFQSVDRAPPPAVTGGAGPDEQTERTRRVVRPGVTMMLRMKDCRPTPPHPLRISGRTWAARQWRGRYGRYC